mmetsp:Transcript_42905/g.93277  ORF Transcript_42905/g.93277 Transcript_42905/m.93277 type:complete len:368 (+) Transcript_42905:41-1144(+)
MSAQDKKKKGGLSLFVLGFLGLLLAIPFVRTYNAREPFTYLIPNALLFTPFRELTREYWGKVLVKVDKNVNRPPVQVATIAAKDYSFESLRVATQNWRYPAVVKGLFNGVPGMEKWKDVNYLNSKLGHFEIPVVKKAVYNTLQNDRAIMPFSEAHTDIMTNEDSKMYLFFPVQSRFNFNGSEQGQMEKLKTAVNDLVVEDLQLGERIWKGFGGPNHQNYYGAQLIIGRGSNDTDATTGTGWHCAAGNNWFVQVVGKKRWYFMDPVDSALLSPLRGGKVNMQTGNRQMADYLGHIPMRYADVEAGDLLYNPDWEWHTIKNYEGLSIATPIREFNMSLSFQNNAQYTLIILANKLAERFGVDIGGYPPA